MGTRGVVVNWEESTQVDTVKHPLRLNIGPADKKQQHYLKLSKCMHAGFHLGLKVWGKGLRTLQNVWPFFGGEAPPQPPPLDETLAWTHDTSIKYIHCTCCIIFTGTRSLRTKDCSILMPYSRYNYFEGYELSWKDC